MTDRYNQIRIREKSKREHTTVVQDHQTLGRGMLLVSATQIGLGNT